MSDQNPNNAIVNLSNPSNGIALNAGINFGFDKSDLISIMEQQLSDGYKAKLKQLRDVMTARAATEQKFSKVIQARSKEVVDAVYGIGNTSSPYNALIGTIAELNNGIRPQVNYTWVIDNKLDENNQITKEKEFVITHKINICPVHSKRHSKAAAGELEFVSCLPIPEDLISLMDRQNKFLTNNTAFIDMQRALEAERRDMPSILLRVRATLAKFAYSQSEIGRSAMEMIGAANVGDLKKQTDTMFQDLILNKPIPEFDEDLSGI